MIFMASVIYHGATHKVRTHRGGGGSRAMRMHCAQEKRVRAAAHVHIFSKMLIFVKPNEIILILTINTVSLLFYQVCVDLEGAVLPIYISYIQEKMDTMLKTILKISNKGNKS